MPSNGVTRLQIYNKSVAKSRHNLIVVQNIFIKHEIYLHILSFFKMEMVLVIEILPH